MQVCVCVSVSASLCLLQQYFRHIIWLYSMLSNLRKWANNSHPLCVCSGFCVNTITELFFRNLHFLSSSSQKTCYAMFGACRKSSSLFASCPLRNKYSVSERWSARFPTSLRKHTHATPPICHIYGYPHADTKPLEWHPCS